MTNVKTAIFFSIFALIFSVCSAAEAPRVAVSIKPLHSIVAAITDGVAEPDLIVKNNASPHHYSMKPSDAKTIQQAELFFLTSRHLETFLDKALDNVGGHTQVVEMALLPGITLLPIRGHHEHEHDEEEPDEVNDPHIWLSVDNAVVMATEIARIMAEKDVAHSSLYNANLAKFIARSKAETATIAEKLASYHDAPYLVFHDAYQYYEKTFGLNMQGSISYPFQESISAKHLKEMQKVIVDKKAQCLFGEPQFSSAVMETISQQNHIHTGLLDPLGSAVPAGKDAYFIMLNDIADNIIGCFSSKVD